jgi:uncharacterized protein YuzE
MKISYHKDTDSLYMHLKETATLESQELAPGTVLHFDEDGGITGLEIYYGAKEKVDLSNVEVVGLETQAMEAQSQTGRWQTARTRKYVTKKSKKPTVAHDYRRSSAAQVV